MHSTRSNSLSIFMRSEGSCCWFSYLKVLLGAVAVGLFVWLLIVGSPESREPQAAKTTSWTEVGWSEAEGSHVKQGKVVELNFMSKVRVPKGPDPIHNRRIGVRGGPPKGA